MSAEGIPSPSAHHEEDVLLSESEAPVCSSNSSQSHGVGKKIISGASYHIRERDLRKIHRAAYRGDVPEVQRLLLLHPERLNDRDRKKR